MTDSENSKGSGPDRPGLDASIKSVLSIALIGPDEDRRRAFMNVLSGRQNTEIEEFNSYPKLDELPQAFGNRFDVIILDADCDPDYVFDMVARLGTTSNASVMCYSAESDVKQAVRFMRAGAREYFTLPLVPAEVAGALTRASLPQAPVAVQAPKTNGQVFVFLGTKGGCGVTTIAANFAISVYTETNQSTLLIDLGQPLGDAGLNLGMVANYSTANALREYARLDSSFLSTLIAKHDTGLSVLAAPSEFPKDQPPLEAFDKLLAIARQSFNYVIIDVGSRIDLMDSSVFDESSAVYLITQVGISELRNANRFISQYFGLRGRSLQIVLNRYTSNMLLFDDAQITKALTRPAHWKIPDDYSTARRTRETATPIALEDSSIAIEIRKMARTACGLPEEKKRRKGFSLFGK
jgi:Flp pilus assembly protein, ATPase CpaE